MINLLEIVSAISDVKTGSFPMASHAMVLAPEYRKSKVGALMKKDIDSLDTMRTTKAMVIVTKISKGDKMSTLPMDLMPAAGHKKYELVKKKPKLKKIKMEVYKPKMKYKKIKMKVPVKKMKKKKVKGYMVKKHHEHY